MGTSTTSKAWQFLPGVVQVIPREKQHDLSLERHKLEVTFQANLEATHLWPMALPKNTYIYVYIYIYICYHLYKEIAFQVT